MDHLKKAREIKDEIISFRRFFHQNAEVGTENPITMNFISEKLKSFGIEPIPCGGGITAELGHGEKAILLRADTDALPMDEETGLSFASKNPGVFHGCGHDLHAAMLLGAAKLLKIEENSLKGRVILMFQPGEEVLRGAEAMLKTGFLEKYRVSAALAFHVGAGRMPAGTFLYNKGPEPLMFSADGFCITVTGRASHGAYPHKGVDAIGIGARMITAFQSLRACEVDPLHPCSITVGKFGAGSAPNVLAENAELRGSLRAGTKEARELLKKRMKEVTEGIAGTFRGEASIDFESGVPPLVCNAEFTEKIVSYLKDSIGLDSVPGIRSGASEDFSLVLEKVPGTYIFLSAGFDDERGDAPAHNSRCMFDEDVLPIGAAAYASCAQRWLEEN